MTIPIFIGYDSREKFASDVCEYSFRNSTKKSIDIKYLKLNELKKREYTQGKRMR